MTIVIDNDKLGKILPNMPTDVAVFTDAAILIVTEELGSSGLSAERLNLIATYLAAHYISLSDPDRDFSLSSRQVGEVKEAFKDSGKGFEATVFGQQALSLDTTGSLTAMSNKKGKALFRVV